MKPAIEQAIEELRRCFSDAAVAADAKDDGSAVVTIDSVDLGHLYTPQQTWIKFAITFQYPHADIYPLFVRPDLERADAQPHAQGITWAQFERQPALQLSRQSKNLNFEIDNAVLKVTKVILWLKEQ